MPAEQEKVSLDNCNGTSVLSRLLSTELSVRKRVFIGSTAHLSYTKVNRSGFIAKGKTWLVNTINPAKGEIELSAEAKNDLIAEIELTFEAEYEEAKGRVDSVDMKAAPGSYIVYTIEWVQKKQEFEVNFSIGEKTYSTSYSYLITIPNKISSKQEICPFRIVSASHLDSGQLMFTLESENMGSEKFIIKTSEKDYPCSKWGSNTKRLYCTGPDLEPGIYTIQLMTQIENKHVLDSSFEVP